MTFEEAKFNCRQFCAVCNEKVCPLMDNSMDTTTDTTVEGKVVTDIRIENVKLIADISKLKDGMYAVLDIMAKKRKTTTIILSVGIAFFLISWIIGIFELKSITHGLSIAVMLVGIYFGVTYIIRGIFESDSDNDYEYIADAAIKNGLAFQSKDSKLSLRTVESMRDSSLSDWLLMILDMPDSNEICGMAELLKIILRNKSCVIDVGYNMDEDEPMIRVTTEENIIGYPIDTLYVDFDKYKGNGSDLVLYVDFDEITISQNAFEMKPLNISV